MEVAVADSGHRLEVVPFPPLRHLLAQGIPCGYPAVLGCPVRDRLQRRGVMARELGRGPGRGSGAPGSRRRPPPRRSTSWTLTEEGTDTTGPLRRHGWCPLVDRAHHPCQVATSSAVSRTMRNPPRLPPDVATPPPAVYDSHLK